MGKNQIAGERFLALDIFRGITIALMILVNMPGSWDYLYSPLHHAEWHGFTFADLVFPVFLFIVGVSIKFAFEKYEYSLQPRLVKKILTRTLILFAIGIFLNSYPFYMALGEIRIMGVLQRIALSYCIASFLILFFSARQLMVISAAVLAGYWLVLGLYGNAPFALETNLVRAADRLILGDGHLWQELGLPFDPEGLLSTIPATVNVLIGFLTGWYLGKRPYFFRKNMNLLAAGVGMLVTALFWNLVFPINKSLWTSSYVLLSSGLAIIIFVALIALVDKVGTKFWARPWIALGSNPLVIYAISILWANTLWMLVIQDSTGRSWEGYEWVYAFLFQPWAGNYLGSLMFGIFHVAVFTAVAVILHYKKVLIRI